MFLTEKKKAHNEIFADLVIRYAGVSAVALILDGAELQTATALNMLARDNVHSPDIDQLSVAAHIAAGYKSSVCSLGDYIKGLYDAEIYPNVAYFDYCSSIIGNMKTGRFPLEDVIEFLRGNRNTTVVFCATFALRAGGKRLRGVVDAEGKPLPMVKITQRSLKAAFKYTGWNIIESNIEDVVSYRNDVGCSMVFIHSVLERASPQIGEYIDLVDAKFVPDGRGGLLGFYL